MPEEMRMKSGLLIVVGMLVTLTGIELAVFGVRYRHSSS
jgi:hypothetical protein